MQRHLKRVQVSKRLANLRVWNPFRSKYSSCFIWDEYLQVKQVPHPLIIEFFNHSHFLELTLYLSGTYCTY